MYSYNRYLTTFKRIQKVNPFHINIVLQSHETMTVENNKIVLSVKRPREQSNKVPRIFAEITYYHS